jgi:tubulin-specific chaperone D
MKPHVQTLSTNLIIISLFDREVNCRRAASATFQECVGRQGNFPHGIEILTEADYFTLANKTNAYLNVSVYVGQFEEYLEPMINHLVNEKLKHYEESLRQLAAEALAVLCVFNPQLVVSKYLSTLLTNIYSKQLHVRSGALMGLAELILGTRSNEMSLKETERIDFRFRQ